MYLSDFFPSLIPSNASFLHFHPQAQIFQFKTFPIPIFHHRNPNLKIPIVDLHALPQYAVKLS